MINKGIIAHLSIVLPV